MVLSKPRPFRPILATQAQLFLQALLQALQAHQPHLTLSNPLEAGHDTSVHTPNASSEKARLPALPLPLGINQHTTNSLPSCPASQQQTDASKTARGKSKGVQLNGIEGRTHLLWISDARETAPSDVGTVGEMVQQVLRLCDLVQIAGPPHPALQRRSDRHDALGPSIRSGNGWVGWEEKARGNRRSGHRESPGEIGMEMVGKMHVEEYDDWGPQHYLYGLGSMTKQGCVSVPSSWW